MKKCFCLFICIIISILFLQGCKAENGKNNGESLTKKSVNAVAKTKGENNVSQNSTFKKDIKMRNKYKMNIYVDGNMGEAYRLDSNGNLVLYDNSPYFNVLDEMYVKYYDANRTYNDDKAKLENKYEKLLSEYEKNLSITPKHSDFNITNYKDGVCINSYKGSDEHVVIPSEINGKKVIKIGASLSQGEYDINYELPFENHKIKSITIPSTVKEIVLNAFDGCGVNSDENCLENIYVDSNNPYYTSADGILYNKDKTCLLQIPYNYKKKTVEVKKGTKAVYCSGGKNIDTLIIPSSVISFGEEFDKYANKKVTNYRDYTWGAPYAVYYKAEVCNFKVSQKNKYYSSEDGVLYNKDKTALLLYPELNERKSFVVPDSVSVIDEAIDFGATNLKSITIGRNVKKIYATCESLFEDKLTIKGYKNTVAENFVEKQRQKYAFDNNAHFKFVELS